jgi:hypothetical protein
MGFRSRMIPSLEVLRNDGRLCGGFTAKPATQTQKPVISQPTQDVGNTSKRRNTDPSSPFIPINLII